MSFRKLSQTKKHLLSEMICYVQNDSMIQIRGIHNGLDDRQYRNSGRVYLCQ